MVFRLFCKTQEDFHFLNLLCYQLEKVKYYTKVINFFNLKTQILTCNSAIASVFNVTLLGAVYLSFAVLLSVTKIPGAPSSSSSLSVSTRGAIHILRKHIFRLFLAPSLQRKHSLRVNF